MHFSSKVCEQLRHYVYLYVDPRDSRPFYVGKGVGNRCFAHLKDQSESAKVRWITDLHKLGYEPRIEILRHGLTQNESLLVEAAAIDLIGVDQLTNKVRGHGGDEHARCEARDVAMALEARPIEIKDPVLLINISRAYRFGMSDIELYDATRSAWVLGERRRLAKYALAVFRGVVREVYEIETWVPGGSTMRKDPPPDAINPKRYEFVGRIADEKARNRYHGKSAADYFAKGAANPVQYVGC